MITPAFYEAFANVLASHDLMHALYRDPDRVRTKYALSAEELRLLCSASPAGVHLSQSIVRGKRLRALELMLPQSRRVLGEFDGDRLLAAYLDDVLLRSDVDMLHAVTHARDFVSWLQRQPADGLPAGLLDLARFELTVLDLSGDPAAAIVARDRSSVQTGPVHVRGFGIDDNPCFVLAADVRAEAFDIDVLALPAEVSMASLCAVTHRPGGVLFRKVWGTRLPVCFRIGVATAEMLRLCDGRRAVVDVLTIVVGDEPSQRSRALTVLQRLTDQAFVHVSAPTATVTTLPSEDQSCVSVLS
jgi:hypothetical protein